jgi:5S rRNA maturation endonuclease (ribonuclease M5)
MIIKKNSQKERKIQLTKEHLVVCEGKDDKKFLEALFWYLSKKDCLFTKIQILSSNGVTNLSQLLSLIKIDQNIDIIRSITIVRDADTNFKAACDSVKNIFKNLGFSVP